MVLQVGIALFDIVFHLIDGIQHRGVILVDFLTDIGSTKVRQLADQVDGDLSCLCGNFIFQGTAQNGFIDGIELADLRNDQTGGGQGVAFTLEHIRNGAGYIFQCQFHTVQIYIST